MAQKIVKLVCSGCGILLFLMSLANGAEFRFAGTSPDPNGYADQVQLEMSGPIEEGDVEKLKKLIAELDEKKISLFRTTTMALDSPGGVLDDSIAIANLLRDTGIATYVDKGKKCLSGCAIIFMGGNWRDGDDTYDPNKSLHPEGILGFHAPFAFDGKDVPVEVQKLLLKNAERGGALAASKLVKLTLNNILPASLVEELLQYESGSFLYIDSVDRAGRWKIPLAGEKKLQTDPAAIMTVHPKLSSHCDNHIYWNSDVSFENRTGGGGGLAENSLWFDGMDTGCKYEASAGGVSYEVTGMKSSDQGSVIEWQTLPANTPIAKLASSFGTTSKAKKEPFANPPPSQISGACKDGFQWIGGWSGANWKNGLAYTHYRRCDGSRTILAYECTHGTGNITRRIYLKALAPRVGQKPKVTTQVDDNYELGGSAFETKNGSLQEVSTLSKDYFTFKEVKSGRQMVVRIDGNPYAIHLKDSRKAFEAMEASCF